jgi:hypothetical protein
MGLVYQHITRLKQLNMSTGSALNFSIFPRAARRQHTTRSDPPSFSAVQPKQSKFACGGEEFAAPTVWFQDH